jgi:hypothetical protein
MLKQDSSRETSWHDEMPKHRCQNMLYAEWNNKD